jgi:hypothetical protein
MAYKKNLNATIRHRNWDDLQEQIKMLKGAYFGRWGEWSYTVEPIAASPTYNVDSKLCNPNAAPVLASVTFEAKVTITWSND